MSELDDVQERLQRTAAELVVRVPTQCECPPAPPPVVNVTVVPASIEVIHASARKWCFAVERDEEGRLSGMIATRVDPP